MAKKKRLQTKTKIFRNQKSGKPCSLSISLGKARPNIYSIIFANCYNYKGWDLGHNKYIIYTEISTKIIKNQQAQLMFGAGAERGSFYKINVKLERN